MTEPGHSAPGSNPVAALRHDLRTPVNHIVGYAEMLIEDLSGPEHATRRAALETAIGAAREALKAISLALAPTRDSIEPGELTGLYARLEGPQKKIIDAIRSVMTATGEMPTENFLEDLQRIEAAAGKLVPKGNGGTAGQADKGAGKAGGGRARVLVVDDEAGNRDLLSRRIQREGYEVLSASGGHEALAMVASQRPDVVLLDVMMPDLDGLAVLEKLKGDAATHDVPVIMISALDDLGAIAKCIEKGALDYLPKPFDPQILRARLSSSLAEKRFRDAEREMVRALGVVTEAASAVEAGAYRAGQLGEIAQRGDAIGRLARVMDRMATEVGERERRLRGRVDLLKGEITVARQSSHALHDEDDRLRSGEVFAGRYSIESVLGRGGMGTVYKAKDSELGETVAIKTLRPELVMDEAGRERFKDEIRLTRRITHRNVVRTHDFGEHDGLWYLTMEYVEGLTVRELLDARGKLGVEPALAIGVQLAESLVVAHQMGVIHRDIKPQNMLLDDAGVLKVMDFGVARLAAVNQGHTMEGMIVGTPMYMAPEQLAGDQVDARADLYAAGVVLFEVLTGELPINSPTVMGLFTKVLSEPARRASSLAADVPAGLDELIGQLLEKDPTRRVPSAAVLLERLQALA